MVAFDRQFGTLFKNYQISIPKDLRLFQTPCLPLIGKRNFARQFVMFFWAQCFHATSNIFSKKTDYTKTWKNVWLGATLEKIPALHLKCGLSLSINTGHAAKC